MKTSDFEIENPCGFLSEAEIEKQLRDNPRFAEFWSKNAMWILRRRPKLEDPIYEIQLALQFDERIETYAWLWVDAWSGELLEMHAE